MDNERWKRVCDLTEAMMRSYGADTKSAIRVALGMLMGVSESAFRALEHSIVGDIHDGE